LLSPDKDIHKSKHKESKQT